MAGYWPSSFIACFRTETHSNSINTQRDQYPAIFTEQTLSINQLKPGHFWHFRVT